MTKEYKKVMVGLDIGTESVGWCVTDENSNIIKKNGKSLWGVRMFDEANDASTRRGFRSARRRLDRRKERINLLRSLFEEEINKVDNTFFYRLDNSFFYNEDRKDPFEYTLFNDKNYNDKNYYKEYPTIYHLRKHLLESDKKEDIRLIYLAFHHMIKYRGNFLNSSDDFEPMNTNEIKEYLYAFKESIDSMIQENDEDGEISFGLDSICEIDDCMISRLKEVNENTSKISLIKEEYQKILNPKNNKYIKDILIPLMAGSEIAVSKMKLGIDDEELNKKKLCVSNEEFDLIIESLYSSSPNSSQMIDLFVVCKKIYDFFLLGKLLGDESYLSNAMVSVYETHKTQLAELKKYVKQNCPKDVYYKIFRSRKETNNYVNYVGMNQINGKKETFKHAAQIDFYKKLKELLGFDKKKEAQMTEFEKRINDLMQVSLYLPKQNSSSNGVFPYQLNLMEMKEIIEKQSRYYDFFDVIDENGYSTKEKLISILKYKIPYYVGPLIQPIDSSSRSIHSWIVRTNEKIYPWNFDKVVDKDQTAENFILRMLTKCTYLNDCYCLPKNSLIFSYYNVLSVLNKTMVNGALMKYEDKMGLIESVFKNPQTRKPKISNVKAYFKIKYGVDAVDLAFPSGKETKDMNCDMSSYCDFVEIFGKEYVENNADIIEEIIKDICVFEDKAILEKRLFAKYGFNKETVKKIKGKNYSGYGRLSKELLTSLKTEIEIEGEKIECNILSLMEKTNSNLQEIIFDKKYKFQEKIEEYNRFKNASSHISGIKEFVENMGTVSPAMKRPLIQAFKICEEVEKILGRRIDEYYVECTRSNKDKEKGKTKLSRKARLQDVYAEAIKNATGEFKAELQKMKNQLDYEPDSKIQSDRIYLYFVQMGKCMYSGEPIDFERLDSNLYDIDHIYPQSLIKDDSLTNRVLVKQELNKEKTDKYPIPKEMLFKTNGGFKVAKGFYKELLSKKLINEEKYKRLTALELSEEELEKFINRQLVFTNQAVKGFINAINYFKKTDDFTPKIIYSKAENISDFRHKYDLVKSREANNYHHAHDAYLNVVVGRTINTYFNKFNRNDEYRKYLWMHENGYTTNFMNIFDQNKNNSKQNIVDDCGIVWDYENSLKIIDKNIYERFDILTTERAYIGNKKGNGLLSKQTLYPSDEATIPVKTQKENPLAILNESGRPKYGGFKGYTYSSFSIVKTNDKHYLIAIPELFRNNPLDYARKIYHDCNIVISDLGINTIFVSNKKKYALTGKDNDSSTRVKNMIERNFSKEYIHILKNIEKLLDKVGKDERFINESDFQKSKGIIVEDNQIYVSITKNDAIKGRTITRKELIFAFNELKKMYEKEIYSYNITEKVLKNMTDGYDYFAKSDIFNMCKVIYILQKYMKCNSSEKIDFAPLGINENGCLLKFGNALSNCKIVFESITGYYSKTILEIK